MMKINQNILRTFSNLQKSYEKLHTKKNSAAESEFLGKLSNIKRISNEHFNLCEAEISLDEIIKFRWNHKILKKTTNLQVMMAIKQSFKNTFKWTSSCPFRCLQL